MLIVEGTIPLRPVEADKRPTCKPSLASALKTKRETGERITPPLIDCSCIGAVPLLTSIRQT